MILVVFVLFGFVALIVVMIHGSFVWSIQFVPFLPVHICHPHLLPLVDIFEILAFMACIFQQVSIAECVVRRCNWGFKRPGHPVLILVYFLKEPSRLALFWPVLIVRHSIHIAELELLIALAIEFVYVSTRVCIDCDHGIFTCITTVQHLNHLCIPFCLCNVAAYDLKLISLILVVALQHMAGVEIACSLLVRYFFHIDRRCIWELFMHGFDVFLEFSHQLLIFLIPKVVLIVDDYAKTFWVDSLLDYRS